MDMIEVRRRVMLSMANGDCKLLSTVTLQSSQRTCAIPLDNSWLQKYKTLILICHIESNATGTDPDWLYFDFNNLSYSHGQYLLFNSTVVKNVALSAFIYDTKIVLTAPSGVNNNRTYDIEQSDNFLRFNLYSSYLTEGTIAKLYGIK